jgi:glucokinase
MSLYEARGGAAAEPLCVKYYRNAEALPEAERGDPAVFQRRIVGPFLRHCWETLLPGGRVEPLHESEILACLATAGLVRKCRSTGSSSVKSSVFGSQLSTPISRV